MFVDVTLQCDNYHWERVFRTAIGDLVGNIQPWKNLRGQTREVLLAGIHYDRPWTRDAAINSWNGLSLLWPDVARDTLESVLCEDDHGLRIGGQYWDAVIWILGAWNHYLVTDDREFLHQLQTVAANSLRYFIATEFDEKDGLFRGPGCFLDGISGYPEHYRRADDWSCGIADWPERSPDMRHPLGEGFPGKTLSTNVLYYLAFKTMEPIAGACGESVQPEWQQRADSLRSAIRRHFYHPETHRLDYLVDDWGGSDRQEGIGLSFALLSDLVDDAEARALIAHTQRSAQGLPCLWPAWKRYAGLPDSPFGLQSGTIWPQVNAFWVDACCKHGAHEEAARELQLLSDRAFRDGHFTEIYRSDTGARDTFWQEAPSIQNFKRWESQPRQSWCATGYLRMLLCVCGGWKVDEQGYQLHPWLPKGIDHLAIKGLHFRGERLDINLHRSADGSVVCEK